MKRLSLLLSFVLSFILCNNSNSFAQGSTPILPGNNPNPYGICELPPPGCQEEPICTFYDDCFRFDFYAPKPGSTPGTTVLKHKITNFSESTFKRATFELPGVGNNRTPAVLPVNSFQNRYNHAVINPFNGISIAYDAINAGTFSYGGFEVYYYIVNTAEFNANGNLITVTASAGRPWQQQRTGSIVIDVDDCIPPTPGVDFCVYKEDSVAQIAAGLDFWSGDAQGNAPLSFTVFNNSSVAIDYVEFETDANAVISPANGSVYNSPANVPAFTYSVSNNGTILRFTGTSVAGFVNGASDIFNFLLDGQIISTLGGVVTVRVRRTDNVLYEEIFEVFECGEIFPLPVSLTSFKGRLTPDGTNLDWITASEKDNDRFEIERSANGRNFEKIGTVKGNGNSSSTNTYSFLDPNPLQGTNYYRLRQVDFDGKHEYSKIVNVKNGTGKGESLAVMLLPNPCDGQQCSVRLKATDQANPITIELQDLAGRIVFSKQIPADQTTFELPKLDSGNGIYILTAKNGQNTAHQKVIIQ